MVTSLTARRPGRLPSSHGQVWHWAGADPLPETAHPLKSPNADTASTTAYNHADNATPQRRTFVDPTPTEGDERHLWGQGRPQAKDSSGAGSNWATGTISQPTGLGVPAVESRLAYEGTVTTGLDRATDAREKGRIGLFGTGLSYAGSYGRVTSEAIGRDINPLGRGDGMAYVAGWMNLGELIPPQPRALPAFGIGNSANNGCCDNYCAECIKSCYANCDALSDNWVLYRQCQEFCRSKNGPCAGYCFGGEPIPPEGSFTQGDECSGKSFSPCKLGSSKTGRFICGAAGAKFAMPSPWDFCYAKKQGRNICAEQGTFCALGVCLPQALADGLMSALGSLLADLTNKVPKALALRGVTLEKWKQAISKGTDGFWSFLATLFGLDRNDAAAALGQLAQFLIDLAFAVLGRGRIQVVKLLTKLLACTGCCISLTYQCAAVRAGGSCDTMDGENDHADKSW